MSAQLQQAIDLTQRAVGRLQDVFGKLAAKMEADVQILKTGLERVARNAYALKNEIELLKREVAALKAAAAARPQPGLVEKAFAGAVVERPAPATSAPVRPLTHTTPAVSDGRRVAAEILPPDDDAFFSGAEDDDS
jgi:septal ring factor EnvC (AmiA/AmiB activator)